MALNTWGMPRKFGSEYKEERMVSIADELSKGHYDIYLFEELWMQPDHTTVAAKIPEGYHMTAFRQVWLKQLTRSVSTQGDLTLQGDSGGHKPWLG